jgi:hypothetical protein
MSRHALWLSAAAVVISCFACGGGDDGEDPADGDDSPGGASPQGAASPGAQLPTQEQITGALADAGVFIDDGGVTIGDSRVDLGPDGIRLDDAAVVSITDSSIVLGSGDGSIAIRTDGTCAELLTCCETLTDEAKQTECTTTHADLMAIPFGAGDFLCGQFVSSYCP